MYKISEFFFKYRTLMPLPWILYLFYHSLNHDFLHDFSWSLLTLGWFFILLGEALRIYSVGYAGSVTRTRGNDTGNSLVSSGPYRYVRNPLYIANVIQYLAMGIVFQLSFSILMLMLIYFVIEYFFITQYEFYILTKQFGHQYLAYCIKVPAWIPRLHSEQEKSQHEYHFKKALRSERSTLLLILFFLMYYIGIIWIQTGM